MGDRELTGAYPWRLVLPMLLLDGTCGGAAVVAFAGPRRSDVAMPQFAARAISDSGRLRGLAWATVVRIATH
jgi:hypothetical protein